MPRGFVVELFTVPAQGRDVPAWFGKLPGMGDFGHRRLASGFLEAWDTWLQTGLQQLRAEREDWVKHYLEAPLWFFALGEDLIGSNPWIGVLMPSVDSVGRYFPLTLAIELVRSDAPSTDHALASIHEWWHRSANTALTALDANMDATNFDAHLHVQFGQDAALPTVHSSMLTMPGAGMSSWLVNVGEGDGFVNTIVGLPTPGGFEVLFGYANLPTAQR